MDVAKGIEQPQPFLASRENPDTFVSRYCRERWKSRKPELMVGSFPETNTLECAQTDLKRNVLFAELMGKPLH
jgi:hypothetical protein